MTYAEKLQDPRWQKKRLKILERDNWSCQLCGDNDVTLHIHHLKYSGNPWDVKDDDLITYCKCCHSLIEFLKKGYKGNMLKSLIKEPPVFRDHPLYYVKIGDTNTDAYDRALLIKIMEDGPSLIICLWPSQSAILNTIFESNKQEPVYV